MKTILALSAVLLLTVPAIAGEKVTGTNYMVVDQQSWKTGDKTGYWMMHATGVSETVGGNLGRSAVECHGAGYWGAGGPWGEGICVHGTGDDTRTSTWKRGKGQEPGVWKFIGGTGKFKGITGEGTYMPTNLPGKRIVSDWKGEINLPQ